MSLDSFLENAASEGLSVYSFSIFHQGGFSQVWFASIDPDKNVSYQGHLFTIALDKEESVSRAMADRVYVIHHVRPEPMKEEAEQ